MKRILLIFLCDLKRRIKAPTGVLVLLFIPFAMTALMGMIFAPSGDGSQMVKVKVLVVDKDKNIASRIFLGALDSPQLQEMFETSVVDEKVGNQRMGAGKATAMIVIPEGFTDAILNVRQTELKVVKNPSQQFLPAMVEDFMGLFATIVSGVVQVFEGELKGINRLTKMPIRDISVTDLTPYLEGVKNKISDLSSYLNPIMLQLKSETVGKKEKKERFDIFAFVLPAISIMFILFIIEIFMREILTEREDGKLRRIMFSPIHAMEFILGRIVSGWLMGIMVYLILVIMGTMVFSISWGNLWYLFIFVAVSCFWIASFFALLNSFFKNKNQAGAITSPIIIAFSAFGGSIIQVDQLPQGMGFVANFTFNHWFITGTRAINSGRFPWMPFIIILVSGFILFSVAVVTLNRRIAT